MRAENDNLTLVEFKMNAAPKPSVAEVRPGPGTVFYELAARGRDFLLLRTGMTKIAEMKDHPPVFTSFPTAAAPHRMCPPHAYAPPSSAPRGANKKVGRPGYIRGVAIGDGRSTEKRAHLRAI